MSLFKRLKDLTLANINSLLDKAEDPVKMLDQYLRDMEEDIQDASEAVAQQIAVTKKFETQYREAEAMVQKRQDDAVKAINAGRDDLARRALEDKKNHETRMNEYKTQFETHSATSQKLKQQLSDMRGEFDKLKARRDTLVARANAAKATEQVHNLMGGFDSQSARRGFERMEDKVASMEARAEASKELSRGPNASLDDELASLNKGSVVDDELAALKRQLGK
ncbi:PspA/IM30 family protein [Heliobacterium gestii]|uniref:PspA/IM30 family protein n=1 Tax=Heliomicrobium gestii TaxID=2699 RepID=A0A845LC51_HELGE|nr:PspA/IM30 family protein [Heliomicrobium gestii]MBM7866174.1 phage shock protein A [Heliomicrobium gestii]MZP42500.1 PspA/IM30 family protein [Heliomicrobium gestii]